MTTLKRLITQTCIPILHQSFHFSKKRSGKPLEVSLNLTFHILIGYRVWSRLNPMRFLLTTTLFLLLLTPFIHGQSSEKPCYISLNSSGEFNQVLLSNISTSLISQYIRQVSPFPSGGLSGSNHCIYEVSVTKDGEKTFVTLQGKYLNSFGDSFISGIDGFQ